MKKVVCLGLLISCFLVIGGCDNGKKYQENSNQSKTIESLEKANKKLKKQAKTTDQNENASSISISSPGEYVASEDFQPGSYHLVLTEIIDNPDDGVKKGFIFTYQKRKDKEIESEMLFKAGDSIRMRFKKDDVLEIKNGYSSNGWTAELLTEADYVKYQKEASHSTTTESESTVQNVSPSSSQAPEVAASNSSVETHTPEQDPRIGQVLTSPHGHQCTVLRILPNGEQVIKEETSQADYNNDGILTFEELSRAENELTKQNEEIKQRQAEQVQQSQSNDTQQVLITGTGSKYHSRECGNGAFSSISLEGAQSMGLTPCEKCY